MDRQMNIVIASSKEYARFALITMASLFEQHPAQSVHLYFYYHESMEEEINQMRELAFRYHQLFSDIYVDETAPSFVQKYGQLDHPLWFKWLCMEQLAGVCDRVLILGVDLFVQKDLSSFYFQDLQGKGMALIPDLGVLEPNSMIHEVCAQFDLDVSEYVNADVCLVDFNKMKGRLSLQKMLSYYRAHEQPLPFLEQDVLNVYYRQDICVVRDYRYNFLAYIAAECMPPRQNETMLEEAAIVHFAGGKPWKYFKGIPAEMRWLAYAKKTAGYERLLEEILMGTSGFAGEVHQSAVKNIENYRIADRMLTGLECGHTAAAFFEREGIRVIGVYGAGRLCTHLLRQLNNTVEVAYIVDQNSPVLEEGKYRLISLQEITTQSPVDALVVTPVYAFHKIARMLQGKVQARLISLRELYGEEEPKCIY